MIHISSHPKVFSSLKILHTQSIKVPINSLFPVVFLLYHQNISYPKRVANIHLKSSCVAVPPTQTKRVGETTHDMFTQSPLN